MSHSNLNPLNNTFSSTNSNSNKNESLKRKNLTLTQGMKDMICKKKSLL